MNGIPTVVPAVSAPPQQNPKKLLVSCHEAGILLSVSCRTVVRLLSARRLRGVRLGRRVLVDYSSVVALAGRGAPAIRGQKNYGKKPLQAAGQ
jgi:excisionase family DNA binding protein